MPGRVLIVSPRFVPVNAPDIHRVRQCLPYLPESGWDAVVLAVDPAHCDAPIDPWLGRTIPERTRIVTTSAIDVRWTRPLGIGSLDLRAMTHLCAAGNTLLRDERFDLIFFSTTATAVMALGSYWNQRFGVPFVLDLHDPWVTDYYHRPGAPRPPGGPLKYAVSQWLARALEPRAVRRVRHLVTVSPLYRDELVDRYPALQSSQFTVLPFGAPEADFELLQREPVVQSVFDPHDGLEHWVYTGAAGAIMRLSLQALFLALRNARQQQPRRFEQVRLHFVGTDYARGARARPTVQPVADACGVGDLVEERPERIPYFEALQCLRDADALIVPGSDDPGYTASKLFPYILARKPLLAIFHEQSSVVGMLRTIGGATIVPFSSGESPAIVADRITAAWFQVPTLDAPATDWNAFTPYTARAMTRTLCDVFDHVTSAETEAELTAHAA